MSKHSTTPLSQARHGAMIFRIALFAAAASLAAYIPFKYATELHAMEGMYAFLFPLSGLLAIAGMVLAVKPRLACDCNVATRAGLGALAVLWMGTGVLCLKTLTLGIIENPGAGSFAMFHMLAQHVFLSGSVVALAFQPGRMAAWLQGDEALLDREDPASVSAVRHQQG